MFGHTTGMRPMPFHTTSMEIILMGPWKVYFVYTSHFLISPQYYFTSGGSMRFSFSGNLNYYYHEFHGIENSFHDHDYDPCLCPRVWGNITFTLRNSSNPIG